ncbi:OLC1v1027415C1 [Oldenlandia corymbosa var. corymbosa]|uniref:OLC1v1027415C1 n=1 Tax=Oldenlandia corymbosa var. corymbosa TaxID=529605 RepID=A0AAV1CA66_OLDCO|nr:OLC1v1027415C1 [Oldenlandia corymbosa var. corymbosa]
MVSKRQKLARKRFKEENPDLFPKPEPTPPKDPNKKKKKKKDSKFKKKKSEPRDPNNPNSRRKKHPLRVPGMKPGESCYICKAPDHIAKNCPEKAQWEKNKICLFCRQRGHSLKNCSKKSDDSAEKKFCYNCGDTGHSLARCPQPLQDGGTKFARCFICNEQGHLSKNCPKNTHGIYPKGGSCKICGGVTHLAKDCPNKSGKDSNAFGGPRKAFKIDEIPRNQVKKFVSGDDLEDDFMTVKASTDENDKISDSNTKNVKSKTKKGTKVVNFVG